MSDDLREHNSGVKHAVFICTGPCSKRHHRFCSVSYKMKSVRGGACRWSVKGHTMHFLDKAQPVCTRQNQIIRVMDG